MQPGGAEECINHFISQGSMGLSFLLSQLSEGSGSLVDFTHTHYTTGTGMSFMLSQAHPVLPPPLLGRGGGLNNNNNGGDTGCAWDS